MPRRERRATSRVEALELELLELRQYKALQDPARLDECSTLREMAGAIRGREDSNEGDSRSDSRQVLLEAIRDLPPDQLFVASATFAIGNDYPYPALGQRLTRLATRLSEPGKSARSLRRASDEACATLALVIAERERVVRLRGTFERIEQRQPADLTLAVDWLVRFRHYHRMFQHITGIGNDFTVFSQRRYERGEDDAVDVYGPSSLHYFACLLDHLAQFSEYDGMWLFGSADAEVEVREAIYGLTWHPPADDLEQSWLRYELLKVGKAKHLFAEALDREDKGRAFLKRWSDWMRKCNCDPERPSDRCQLHQMIRLSQVYETIVEQEWYRLAGWYRLPPTKFGSESSILPDLLKRFDYVLPDLELGSTGTADEDDEDEG